MKTIKGFFSLQNRLALLLFFCIICFYPMSVYATDLSSDCVLGQLTPSKVHLQYDTQIIDLYNDYGTNYIAISDLRRLGFEANYISSPKTINIILPSSLGQTTTSSALKIKPNSFSFFSGSVYLGNFKTQALVSGGNTFIPVGALSELGSLTMAGDRCIFVPTSVCPVKATDKVIINLSDSPVVVSITDLYWTTELVTSTSSYMLNPGETLDRLPMPKNDTIYLATLVQEVSGTDTPYTNNSLRGQVNEPLLKKYVQLQNRSFLEDYGDPITVDEVIASEDFVNSKNMSSPTSYLVWTNIQKQRTYIFTGSQNNWQLQKCFICSTGKDRTPTPKGTFSLTYKVPSFGQAKGYCCKNAFGFIGTSYLYHSIIFDKTGTHLLEGYGVLGKKASQGCIRFSPEHAKWFYDNLISKTTVYIN